VYTSYESLFVNYGSRLLYLRDSLGSCEMSGRISRARATDMGSSAENSPARENPRIIADAILASLISGAININVF